MKQLPIGLQLYSLRDAAAQDFVGVLRTTAELGYEGVEFAGYGGLSAGEMKGYLDELGLTPISSHISFDELSANFSEIIAYNKEIGSNTLVCPVPPQGFEQSTENWKSFARQMTELGKRCADEGFRLGYHNHSFEFQMFGGLYGLDIFYAEADPKYVFAQLDLGWVLHGGEDPASYLRKFKGRCPLVHVKDFDASKEQTDVGCGELDLPGIIQTAHHVGVEWLILETEVYQVSPEESVKVGLKNLRAAQQ